MRGFRIYCLPDNKVQNRLWGKLWGKMDLETLFQALRIGPSGIRNQADIALGGL